MAPSDFSQDFDDFIAELQEASVEFLVVGAHALAAHGYVRATGDLDIFVRPSRENAERVIKALLKFGAPVAAHGISQGDFEEAGMVYQIGLPPNRIDVLTELTGVSFDECADGSIEGMLGANRVRFIALRAQLKNKLATGRSKDIADAEILAELASHKR